MRFRALGTGAYSTVGLKIEPAEDILRVQRWVSGKIDLLRKVHPTSTFETMGP